ncbi:MAG: hypothetical protein H0W78_16055 [Planctomycetes bacterium]|nr:hypothetical protein [Planctomycetota bacterium]
MRGPDLQPLAAGGAALVLVASLSWWLFSTPELADPGQPTWKGADIVRVQAAVPEIALFDHFYVNHDNPFVPHAQRLAERGVYDPRTRPVAVPPPRPLQIPPPKPPVVVKEPEKPQLVLPKLTKAPSSAPVPYGLLVSDGEEVVIVRMPGANEPMNLKPGGQIGGWTLLSIDSGNLATFLDPQGIEHRFAIGQGDLVVAQDASGTPVPGKNAAAGDKNSGTRGMPPKALPGPVTRPPGVDGPIPRPPPREERPRRERKPDGQDKTTAPQPPPNQPPPPKK